MWFLLIAAILVSVNGNTYIYLCTLDPYQHCHTPDLEPEKIPGNEEELHVLCSEVNDSLQCLHSYDLECRGYSEYEAFKPPLDYIRLKRFVYNACEESTYLHRVLARDLPCIKRFVNDRDVNCSESRDEVIRTYVKYYKTYIMDQGIRRVQTELKKRIDCLHNVYTTGCIMEYIGNECGFGAKDAGINLYSMNIFVDMCGLDVFKELARIVRDLEIDQASQNILLKYFAMYVS